MKMRMKQILIEPGSNIDPAWKMVIMTVIVIVIMMMQSAKKARMVVK